MLHAVSSFDVGGTQTQVAHLCTTSRDTFTHASIEIFPEKNFLFRRGAAIDPALYGGDGLIGRTMRRLVVNPQSRSAQLVQIYKLVKDFSRARPWAVVAWGHEMAATVFVAAACARVPHVVFCIRTFNPELGWIVPPWPARLLSAHRAMLPHVSHVITNSGVLRDDYAQWSAIDPDRIAVCANGVKLSDLSAEHAAVARLRVRRDLQIPSDATVVMAVGRFSLEKGQQFLVDAAAMLRDSHTLRPLVYVLYGDGPSWDSVKAAAATRKLDNVLFPGRTEKVHEVLCAADIFVMPSLYEGMPNAMLEAMAHGLPCVSTEVSGIRDIARPGREAIYCPPADGSALAAAIGRLLAHPEAAREIGDAARHRVSHFSSVRACECIDAVLTTLL